MMRLFKSILPLTLLALLAIGCQSNQYKITGTAEGLSDGDTLVLTVDQMTGNPLQQVTVKGGKFEFTGEVDSVQMCAVFSSKEPDLSANFFLEPGNIKVSLSKEMGKSTVSGTTNNDAWQQLNDTLAIYNEKMQKLATVFYDSNSDSISQVKAMEQLQALQEELMKKVVDAMESNIDNEVGYYLLCNVNDETVLSPTRCRALIDRMPAEFRHRPAIKAIEEDLVKALATEKGNKIEDFSLATPDGKEQSVMDIVKQNKVTILDFWASWCGPCRQEMPNMVSLYAQYHAKGLEIIGISLDEEREAWLKSIKDLNISWPQISDLKGWNSSAAVQFNVRAIPQIIILDEKGVILEKGLRGPQLEAFIGEQLK